jgi:hypothetical protein
MRYNQSIGEAGVITRLLVPCGVRRSYPSAIAAGTPDAERVVMEQPSNDSHRRRQHQRELFEAYTQSVEAANVRLCEFRRSDPNWQKVYAEPTYHECLRRAQAALAALPNGYGGGDPVEGLKHPSVSRWLRRAGRFENYYGADRRTPMERADTPQRFVEWLRRYGEVCYFMLSSNQSASDKILHEAHGRAVDLARLHDSLGVPPERPIAPVNQVDGKAYLLRLREWAKVPVCPDKTVGDPPSKGGRQREFSPEQLAKLWDDYKRSELTEKQWHAQQRDPEQSRRAIHAARAERSRTNRRAQTPVKRK